MPLKVKDILSILKKDGWKMVTQKGSHRQFKHPVKPGQVTVSEHKDSDDISLDMKKSIFKQADLLR